MKTFTTYAEKKAKQFFNLLQGYTKGIRITAILILLLVGATNAWAGGGIYLKPNSNWTKDNARFAAYFFKSSNNSDSKWMSMYASNKSGYYVCAIPDGYDMVIFCRMNGGNQTNDWNNKWNQTGNLNVPSDEKIVCSINSGQWDCGNNVTWSEINWYIAGDFNGWNTTANKMPCDISIESGDHTMKIVSEYGDWFGNTGTMIRGNSSGRTMTYGENSNCTLTADVAGTYNFSCTGTKLTVTYPEECFLKGNFNDWSNTHSILGGSVTIYLKAGTYEFKIHRYDETSDYWVSNDGTMTRDNCSGWTMSSEVNDDCKITADFDGDYTFTYDRSTGKLSVTYPTIYKVTYSHVPTDAADAPTSSISSGAYVLANTSLTFTAKTAKTGYTWKGWYSNNAGNGNALTANKNYTTQITANTTIYAVYTANTYTVELNQEGATTVGTESVTATYGAAMPNITMPARTGYTFGGYYTSNNGGGTQYYTANGTSATNWDIASKTTLYAKWTANKYTITWNANGGSVTPTSSTYTYDGATVTLPTPTRTGYTFNGWFTETSGGTQITNIGTTNKPTSNVTYYAQWTENLANITISSADANKGTVSPTSANVGVATKVEVTATPVDGYYTQTWTATAPAVSSETTGNTTTLSGNGNTGNGTLVATFSERYQLISQHATNTIPGNNPYFTKQGDDSWACIVTLAANTEYSFKVKDYANNSAEYGNSVSALQSCADWVKIWKDANSAIKFKSTQAGSYTIHIRWSGADGISLTAPQVKITYPDLPTTPAVTYTAVRVYEEQTINGWIAGDGAQATPYQFYNDETVRLTVTPLTEVAGLTAYYKVGETEQTANTFDLTNITTEVTPITITTYYKDSYGNKGTEATTTVYFQQVLTPQLLLITDPVKEISLEKVQAGTTVELTYSATYNGYTGSVTIKENELILATTSDTKKVFYRAPTDIGILTFTATTNEVAGRVFETSTEVAVYKLVTIKVNDPNSILSNVYMWRGDDSAEADVKTEWPGESFAQHFGTWRIFVVKYPYYDHFIVNGGSNENQTFNYEITSENKCYLLSDNKVTQNGFTNYTLSVTNCPGDLAVSNIDDITLTEGEQKIVVPSVQVSLGNKLSDVTATVSSADETKATAIMSGTNIIVYGHAEGTTTITVNYTLHGETVTRTFQVTVERDTHITIQVKVPIGGSGTPYDNIGWKDNSNIKIHYWHGSGHNADISSLEFVSEEASKYKYLQAEVPLHTDGKTNFLVYYEYLNNEDVWRKSPDVTNVSTDGCYTMQNEGYGTQPSISRSGDYCWEEADEYQVKIVMQNGKEYSSNIVTSTSDILSFFAPGKDEVNYRSGVVMLYKNDNLHTTIAPATFSESNVYTAQINDDGTGLTNVAVYTGNYYVRTYGNNDWGQRYYQEWTDEQRSQRIFTYFVPREEELYNHYWVDDLEYYSGGKDVSGYVANIYNNDLAGKLVTDHTGTTDATGKIYYGSSEKANVRFGYDPRTNYFCRAILKGSSESNDFLNLYCATAYQDEGCTELVNNGTLKDSKLDDASNWVYEKEFYVPITNSNPTASVYLSATAYNSARNLLLGYEVDEITGEEDVNRPKQRTIIGSGTANGTYHMRIIYDFKTNRLITAWEPQDGITFSEKTTIHSDVLIIRHENNAAPQINLTNAGKVKSLETMYFALEFERGSENASKRHQEQYWFTLPFNCRVGEISGVPGYMQTWGIQRYRGDLRAQKGWFAETPTFWEWLSPNDILEAGEGYLLVFDKKAASWAEFEVRDDDGNVTETRSILRLYFPSTTSGFDLQQQSTEHLTRTYENHTCTIQLHNRYLQDSNWKVIGTTSYNNAGITECTADTDPTYEELTEAPSFRYKYEYTMSDDNKTFWYKYTAEDGKAATYNSFFGYMVQFAGTIQWQPIMSETVPEGIAARRYVPANERTSYTTRLELANAAGEVQDLTFVALDEKATIGFDQNKDLNKVLNRGTNIYTFVEGLPFAGNTLPMEKATVPVGVRIATAGEYTFRMPDGTDGIAVTLVDNATGTHTNMLMSEYTVTLNAGTIENRFYLVVDPDRTATSVENIGEEAKGDKANGVEKFLIDGKLFIRTADGIFDAKGQRL